MTLPQSPTYDVNGTKAAAAGLTNGGRPLSASLAGSAAQAVFRTRRSNTLRSQASTTSTTAGGVGGDSVSLLNPGSTVLHPANAATSTQSGSQALPVQVILSSGTPVHNKESGMKGDVENGGGANTDTGSVHKRTNSNASQTIHVRPMSKRDIFYQGSTLHIPHSQLSLSHQFQSHSSMAHSMVSIPARDIINKVI